MAARQTNDEKWEAWRKAMIDEMLYGNGFLHLRDGRLEHIPATEVFERLGLDVVGETNGDK